MMGAELTIISIVSDALPVRDLGWIAMDGERGPSFNKQGRR
jgi:hypothetical protein